MKYTFLCKRNRNLKSCYLLYLQQLQLRVLTCKHSVARRNRFILNQLKMKAAIYIGEFIFSWKLSCGTDENVCDTGWAQLESMWCTHKRDNS